MSIDSQLAQYFKPALQSGGQALQAKVKLSRPSDTEITAFVNSSASLRVSLKCQSLQSDELIFNCNCPVFQKRQICKHLWAVLLTVESCYPDFLEEKTRIQLGEAHLAPLKKSSDSQVEFKEELKRKQTEYRKLQYEKQKILKKESKQSKRKSKFPPQPEFSLAVQQALSFFSQNGFPISFPLIAEDIRFAKNKLARVFHPDVGGSHEEILALNLNFKVLMQFLDSSS